VLKRYNQSVIHCGNLDAPESSATCFTQWAANNVDHNVNTLEGKGTFHGMGIISLSITLNKISSGHFTESQVPRLQRMNADKVITNQGIDIEHYDLSHKNGFSTINFKPMSDSLQRTHICWWLLILFGIHVCILLYASLNSWHVS